MKILHIMAGGEYGGAETAFVDMCLAMHQSGEAIEVITRSNELRVSQLRQAGITVHILQFGGVFDLGTSRGIKKVIREFQPEIVQGWMNRACRFIPKWTSSMGAPQYLTVARLGTPYKLKYYKNMEYFVALTPDIGAYLARNGIQQSKLTQITNFAEVETVDQPINTEECGVPMSAKLVLGLGRLHADKAFDTLIKVAAALPDIHLWIAGEGPLRSELEQLIKDLNVSDRVKLLGWRTDRAALLQASDVCAFVSRDEGFGTVFLQSWAQKTPLVACDSDGPRQFVRHDIDGLMAPIDNVEAIKNCIERVIKEPGLAERLSETAYQRYKEEFTKEVIVNAYLSYYRQILSQNLKTADE